jgi:hypothetical protein
MKAIQMKFLQRALFLGKTQTVSTPGAGLKFASPKSCASSPTIPRSLTSSAVSATSASESDWHVATTNRKGNGQIQLLKTQTDVFKKHAWIIKIQKTTKIHSNTIPAKPQCYYLT